MSKKSSFFCKYWKDIVIPSVLLCFVVVLRVFAYSISQMLNRPVLKEEILLWESSLFTVNGDTLGSFLQRNYSFSLISTWVYVFVILFAFFVAILAWRKSILTFRLYVYGLLAITFVVVLFNILFPSVAPWFLNDIERLFSSWSFSYFVAFPSLFVMLSFYTASWGEHILGPWGLFLFLIPIFVIFSVLYGGENYLVDCIAGCALASLAFLITAGPNWERK